jgi:hypothetical protein
LYLHWENLRFQSISLVQSHHQEANNKKYVDFKEEEAWDGSVDRTIIEGVLFPCGE